MALMTEVLDSNIEVSQFEQSHGYIHFLTNALGKGMNPSSPKIWVKYDHYCLSTSMALELDNPLRLIYH